MDIFSSLVEEQKSKSDVIQLFGVILYTDKNPNIKKILRDDDYWLALHELTGDNFAVFSVRPERGFYKYPQLPSGIFGMMLKIWNEPSENKKLIDLFEIDSTENLPLLLLFTEVDDRYLSIKLEINDASENDAYNSTKEHLEFACKVISRIKKENYNNPEGIYAALAMEHDHKGTWKIIKNGINIYRAIKDLLL
ncbi:hypothetical protein JD508_16395 [Aeromonas jandaei]|jgi:hypothetical protein|uniref:hypothetical protein n=1 Tax=Aeromonas jandaei TaxID=650 RepID=UPI00191DDCA7|nr:hypothetical protein [Aeromonas jandaei]MBL0611821.1 hypothetical protein [Aeromonas jandaei]